MIITIKTSVSTLAIATAAAASLGYELNYCLLRTRDTQRKFTPKDASAAPAPESPQAVSPAAEGLFEGIAEEEEE